MTAPNIVDVNSIKAFSAAKSTLTTSAQKIIENPASSNCVIKVNDVIITNIDGTNAADVTVDFYRSSTSYPLGYTITVPADASLVLMSKETSIYLEEGDSIRALASANGDLNISISYEIISESDITIDGKWTPPLPSSTYNDSASSTADLTTYTFNSVSFGSETDRNAVVIAYGFAGSGGSRNLSSATIGGQSANIVLNGAGSIDGSGLVYATGVTGTSGTVSITMSGACARMGILCWSLYNLTSTTPHDSASDFGGADGIGSAAITVPANGVGIGFCAFVTGTTPSWSNATKDVDIIGIESAIDFTGARFSSSATVGCVGFSDADLGLVSWG